MAAVDDELARLGDEREVKTAPVQPPVRRIQVGHHLAGDLGLFDCVAVAESPPKNSLARHRRAVVVQQEIRNGREDGRVLTRETRHD
jgi:hypothetical protein